MGPQSRQPLKIVYCYIHCFYLLSWKIPQLLVSRTKSHANFLIIESPIRLEWITVSISTFNTLSLIFDIKPNVYADCDNFMIFFVRIYCFSRENINIPRVYSTDVKQHALSLSLSPSSPLSPPPPPLTHLPSLPLPPLPSSLSLSVQEKQTSRKKKNNKFYSFSPAFPFPYVHQ